MKLKGEFVANAEYSVGDVVLFTDGFVYILREACPAGTEPVDSRYWNKVSSTIQETVILILSYDVGPSNLSDDALLLKGESGDEYIITIDESGDTPDLLVSPANAEPDEPPANVESDEN